jgi:GNAT superfamily N-acetyltransferase
VAEIQLAETEKEFARCFRVMAHLRPYLVESEFAGRIRAQQAQGYRLAVLDDGGEVVAVAGFRVMEMLASGRTLYVDDLVTDESKRSRGFGKAMLDWLEDDAGLARRLCTEVRVRNVQPGFRDTPSGGACVLLSRTDARDELPLCKAADVAQGGAS